MRFFKKLALALLGALVALPAIADGVTPERAREVAAAFFAGGAKRGIGDAQLKAAEVSTDAYMAFNRDGGGFVVIALNDAVTPVLAYSPEGEFPSEKDMPEPMRWWFSSLAEQIAAVGDDVKASGAVRAAWENPEPVRSASKLYETASWSQHEPFNNNCPTIGGERCLTGCVAIAGAILARYFQWPDAGVGTIPAKPSSVSGPDYPAHDLGHSYDWDNMPLYYGSNPTSTQAAAVATLVYDMATIAQMAFGTQASSASSSVLLAGLKQYMKYDKGAYQVDRSEYTDDQWRQLLTDILDNYGPTIYSGRDPRYGGHSFVMDGYDSNGRFHFNWGWGFADCYCTLDALEPEETPYNFSDRHQVIVGLVPDRDGTSSGRDRLVFLKTDDSAGVSADTDTFEKNVAFIGSTGFFGPRINNFSGSVYLSLYDKEGNWKQDISSAYNVSIDLNNYRSTSRTCCITCDIAPGDRIKVRYVGQYNGGIIDSGVGCITEIIVKEDTGDEPDPTAGYTAAQTAASTSLSYDKATATLTLVFAHPANWAVKNSGGTDMTSGVATDGGAIAINMSGYASGTYTISIGSTEDPFTFTITK